MRLGVLDIGSNTVHLLLIDAHPGARPLPFGSHKRSLQLVAYLDERGAISEEGQRELLDFIGEAAEFARTNDAEDLLAFATSAIRESANGQEVLARVYAETGIRLAELSGPDEAAATFLAVRRWYGWGAGNILNLDIGGGSFELAMGADEHPELALSVPLGAGRLTWDLLEGDPPSAKSVKAARKYIRATLAEPIAAFTRLDPATLVAATSKSFRSLARITGAAPRAAGPYVKRELRLSDLTLWANRLAAMSAADRAELPGVSEIRARQMLAAALVAEAALSGLGLDAAQICPWALREGLILQRFDHLRAL
ncbi:Ppx/GppA phosphatase family protein [Subtercola boreus]|uniref:Exopolyphosphatase n=1 Tax=Subtercola boreus TaxID=120213 RepID=A0A3E0W8B9_9MICO|nr:Ppx/GppA family phosphatase [Subtercola boreus]RFA18281.1 exopolyphosphatase [Subtercola boreus]RFA18673.1 exopolyphosphatase [Subtercola boreus]RFA25276.1 exopolyphosphatase [Subtercola boreus]